MRVDHLPLVRPVVANAFVSVDMSAFHAVGPHNVSVQCRQYRFHVAGVEVVLEASEKFGVARHPASHVFMGDKLDE